MSTPLGTTEVRIWRAGPVGRIRLTRAEALNALSPGMVRAIDRAVAGWENDASLRMLVIDAEGDRAFCAGGDIAEVHRLVTAGRIDEARAYWAAEYRMNHRIFAFPKPVAAFLQGYTMGGGVGLACHGSHRIVGESALVAMPECGIGLVPDVGGTLLLARAPGRIGEYLALTGARMGPADAIHAGFADYFVPEGDWPALRLDLETNGDWQAIDRAATAPPPGRLELSHDLIDAVFALKTVPEIAAALDAWSGDLAAAARAALARNAPLSMAAALRMVRNVRQNDDIRFALMQEYRVTARAAALPDLLEGIRAQIIDKDRNPRWSHAPGAVSGADVDALLAPLGTGDLDLPHP
jgi:enoyl-CoA hydratase